MTERIRNTGDELILHDDQHTLLRVTGPTRAARRSTRRRPRSLDLARAVNEERTVTDHNKAHAVECTGLHSAARGQRSYSDWRKGYAHGSVSRSMAVGVVSRIS